jgi:UDP-N-acetylglucosamine 2-epimerase (non-hydrolysing)
MNRVVAGRLATWHFAPTDRASRNLLAEGVPASTVTVTGNTVIDALLSVALRAPTLAVPVDPNRRLLLVTAHRRENFGGPMLEICRALVAIVEEHPDVEVLFPVHPNPNVTSVVQREIAGHPRIRLSEPLEYVQFIAAMQRAHLILTDSGGVQEEAPALAKPVLVLREETERPEAVEAGVARLVGAKRDDIVKAVRVLLTDASEYRTMARGASPYGDGHAAERIVRVLRSHFGLGVGA